MSKHEQITYLIEYLLKENPRYASIEIPESEEEQKKLLRSLMNVRPPYEIDKRFLEIQDQYLKAEIQGCGIVDSSELVSCKRNDKICLWQGDITRLKVDAIVNAANSALLGCFQPLHSCIDNFIHSYSGIQLRLACNELMETQGHEEETGKAKITEAYNLPSQYVIHTVGPIISGELREEDRVLLANCYRSCLEVAVNNQVKSIAFCCISTGVFCFPQEEAARIAIDTVEEFLRMHEGIDRVIFNVFKDEDLEIYHEMLN